MSRYPAQRPACAARQDYRELLREGQSLLRQLDLPLPFTVGTLRDQVQQARGRPLIILALPFPASDESPYGLWAEYPDADFILHEAGTSPAHRDQIVLHEIAHILLGHGAVASLTASGSPVSLATAPGLPMQVPAGRNMRLGYGRAEERHAEITASLLLARASMLTASAAASRLWGYRELRALRPLWSRLTAAAPHVVLCPLLHPADDLRVTGAEVWFRVGRCIVEIRDAELLLRCYVSDASAASARAELAATGLDGEPLEAAAEAAWLRAAIAVRLAGYPPVRPAPTRPLRGGSDVAEEVRWLRLLAAAWDTPAVVSATAVISRSEVPDGNHGS